MHGGDPSDDFAKALKEYDAAIQANPDPWQHWANRGGMLAHFERYDEAARDFREALRLNPDNDSLKRQLAKVESLQR